MDGYSLFVLLNLGVSGLVVCLSSHSSTQPRGPDFEKRAESAPVHSNVNDQGDPVSQAAGECPAGETDEQVVITISRHNLHDSYLSVFLI